MSLVRPVVVVHGGAGDVPDSRVEQKFIGVKKSAIAGYKVLLESGSVLNAIEAAIHVMEDDEAFNAGRGSVLNLDGGVEMEALLMEGKDMKAGAVTSVRNIAHPISLARIIMEKTPHSFLGGEGVEEFIQKMNIPRVSDDYLITEAAKVALEEFKKKRETEANIGGPTEIGESKVGDTVGCVAVDSNGHVASGTSTGGMTGKYKGRIGDTPLPGSGGYSDDSVGAVSTTGYGESILRYNLAHRILTAMVQGESAQNATASACQAMTKRVGKTAGAITVSRDGDVGIGFSSKRMAWAYVMDSKIHFGIDPGQHLIEPLKSEGEI